jgi:hypothetical protein
MLSVRLPENLESQLSNYCQTKGLSKSQVVQKALIVHLSQASQPSQHLVREVDSSDPLAKWLGRSSSSISTDELMRQTRGDDWNLA